MSELRLIKVPFAEKDEAKSRGARWDASSKSWHVPHGVDPAKLMNWWRYLDCPYEEKDSARELGARWDKNTKKWFVPENLDFNDFVEWWPAWVKERVTQDDGDEDEIENSASETYEVVGQAGGTFYLSLDEDFRTEGGTAQVYFGWDEDPVENEELEDPNVAVKFFFQSSDDDFTMFERELNALKTLSPHPNIVDFLDYGYDKNDNTFFIVTKYHHFSLAELLYAQHGAISILGVELDLTEIGAEEVAKKQNQSAVENWNDEYVELIGLLNGLVHAFEKGIMHRDLKPGNIMVASEGDDDKVQLKLIDFGIASRSEVLSKNQATVGHVGTNLYTPEATDEEYDHPETRDVYSFGVIAIEYMSDDDIRTYADLERVLEDYIEPLYPESIVKVLRSCISLRPAKRPKNVLELLKVLERETKKLNKNKSKK